ncbi:Qat anti-phage system ATPase QatA [Shewanella marisflavi]|uniref:KAP P-loop n=1 Tax=Shewanella marisflavi TaxID=260364 RepID=A0AAC9XMI4_9GAMM|nr:Qat anti-phage system ATPase QatA [Shewanella marisflavi]ASJ95633.1 KAP P-loop [Shewanella marisflavi]
MLWPDNESKVDLLNYQAISSAIIKLLSDTSRLPVSVGVHGDWGAGKSSILAMLENSYQDDESTVCIRFNSWLFQGLEDAQTALMQQITSDLIKKRGKVEGFKQQANDFLDRIDWFKSFKTVANWGATVFSGIPTPSAIQDVSQGLDKLKESVTNLSKDDIESGLSALQDVIGKPKAKRVVKEISDFRNEYNKLLKAAKIERLVVLVDDLDRCLPETAIATLEAMKLFLFMPNTAFIVAADETMIEYSVRRHFPKLSEEVGGAAYTRNYLEKLIQVPFRIPALSENETSIYLSLLISQNVLKADEAQFESVLSFARQSLKEPWKKSAISVQKIEELTGKTLSSEDKELFLMASQIAPVLTDGTKGNPRQIKRFLNAFMTRILVADGAGYKDAIKDSVLIKLMILERFNQKAYEQLRKDSLNGDEGVSRALREQEKNIEPQETDPDAKDKVIKAKVAPIFDIENDFWLSQWVRMEPQLGDVDLTPYLFLTREKVKYIGLSQGSELVERLIRILLGSKLEVAAATKLLEQISDDDAENVMDVLLDKISSNAGVKSPPGFAGAQELSKRFNHLQLKLLQTLNALPENKLGTWAPVGWDGVNLTPDARSYLDEMLQKWSQSTENAMLAKVVNTTLKRN